MGKTKEKLKNGQPVLGGWVMIGHPTVVEIMAGEGFDWIGVDMEHTSIDLRTFHELALAVKGTDCDLLARLDSCNEDLTKKVLDLGADGIIVPAVNTAEQARQAVRMATFPPQGTRGASLCRASDFGRGFSSYFRSHNDGVLVVVMLENIEAVEHVDAILATPGLDGALIGPYDLSASMGLPGQLDHADVVAAEEAILEACRRHGVPPGIHVVAPEARQVQERLDQGFRFIACGIDTQLIIQGCRAMLRGTGEGAANGCRDGKCEPNAEGLSAVGGASSHGREVADSRPSE